MVCVILIGPEPDQYPPGKSSDFARSSCLSDYHEMLQGLAQNLIVDGSMSLALDKVWLPFEVIVGSG